jgi:predicted RNA-binding protein with RPS1 domain
MKYDLFGKTKTYLFGRITNLSFVTPEMSYSCKTDIRTPGNYPALLTKPNRVTLFFNSPVFNSYVLSEEENVYCLYSVDDKLTIVSNAKPLLQHSLYTFIITKETEDHRVCELYKFDKSYPGYTGLAVYRQEKVCTDIGTGTIILQAKRKENTTLKVLLYKIDKDLHFIEIDNYFKGFSEFRVIKDCQSFYILSNGMAKGVLKKKQSNRDASVNDILRVRIRCTHNGRHEFTMKDTSPRPSNPQFDLVEGMVYEARIKKVYEHGTIVVINGWEGRMMIGETTSGYVKEWETLLEGKKYITGIVYDVDKMRKRYEFSIKKYENMKKETDLEEGVDLSVPFCHEETIERPDVVVALTEDDYVGENTNILVRERDRAKVECEEDYLMKMKADPEKAYPIIKYVGYKMERGEQEEVLDIIKKSIHLLQNEERDKLAVSYFNLLLYVKNENIYDEVKRLSKICGLEFMRGVIENIDERMDLKGPILELYFMTHKCEKSFKKYLKYLLENEREEGFKLIERTREYLKGSIDLIYFYSRKDARARIEGLIHKCKESWMRYIKNEENDIEYCRGLFKRVVEVGWKVADVKEFYKMWLEFEKRNNGDVEEVKRRAKEYVEREKA